ncbi:MAG: preprotein translocase subunit SecE [Clostridia bacterium]|nr:preprotein translocase subunit SecE [Clostridia bacterium]
MANKSKTSEKASSKKENANVPDYAAKKKKSEPKKSELNAKGKVKLSARISQFFKDIVAEIKKINWTSGKDTLRNTLVVLLVILIVGLGVWITDAALVRIREVIYNYTPADAEAALFYFKALISASL